MTCSIQRPPAASTSLSPNASSNMLYLQITQHSAESVPTILPDLIRTVLIPFMGPRATEEFIAERQSAQLVGRS